MGVAKFLCTIFWEQVYKFNFMHFNRICKILIFELENHTMYFNMFLSQFSVLALQTNPLDIAYLKDFQKFMNTVWEVFSSLTCLTIFCFSLFLHLSQVEACAAIMSFFFFFVHVYIALQISISERRAEEEHLFILGAETGDIWSNATHWTTVHRQEGSKLPWFKVCLR